LLTVLNGDMITRKRRSKAAISSVGDLMKYVEGLKENGLTRCDFIVENGRTMLYGMAGYRGLNDGSYDAVQIAQATSVSKLKMAFMNFRTGQNNFREFRRRLAEAGVSNWVMNLKEKTCVFYDYFGIRMLDDTMNQSRRP
jgi:uncharacterized protein YbcV (DUF1398 family)